MLLYINRFLHTESLPLPQNLGNQLVHEVQQQSFRYPFSNKQQTQCLRRHIETPIYKNKNSIKLNEAPDSLALPIKLNT